MYIRQLLLIIIISSYLSSQAYATAPIDNISGSYVASTRVGNIFCIDITQHGDRIEGRFDEVDFQQVVPIEKGSYRDNRLNFSVHFVVKEMPLLLEMSAERIKKDPLIFQGRYRIGKENGEFILYSVKVKPPICRVLYLK